MVGRHKSSGSRPKLVGRPKHGSYVLRNVGLFAGYTDGSALDRDDAFDLAEQLASHKPGDDASGAGEDAIPNDGNDQASEGAARSPTGRLALRSSRNVDRLRSGGRKIDLDDENDVLRRIGRPLPRPKALLPRGARVSQGGRRQGAGCRRPNGPDYECVAWDAASEAAFASGGPARIEAAEPAAAASAQ